MKQAVNDEQYLDPVFLSVGQRVYRHEYIQQLRKENLERKRDGKRIVNFIPQSGFQEKVLCTNADIKIVGGKRGGGKAVSLDTQILTPYGYRSMGELKVGQRVIDPVSGKAENVLQIFEHHNIDLYEVTFNDGATVKCCMDHLWKIRETGNTKNKSNPTDDIDAGWSIWTFAMVKKWLDEQAQGKHQGQGRKFHLQIPLTNPVEFNYKGASKAHLPYIDPYVIGALLGDGCITNNTRIDASARFCTNDDEIAEQFRLAGIDMSHDYHYKGQTFAEYHIRDRRLEQILDYCKLYGTNSKTKFIPDYYKFASASDRLALLQGLLDTDGWANSTNGKVGFCSTSKKLAEDVRWMVESLGGLATIYTSESRSTKNGVKKTHGDKYEVYIKMPNPSHLFRLKRKADLCKPFNGGRGKECRNIVSYRYVGKEDARCITVSGINRLFLVNDFIVTHNTWIGLFEFLPYIFNPDVSGFGFRKYEDDIARGIWRSSKQVFRGFGSSADSFFEWKFL